MIEYNKINVRPKSRILASHSSYDFLLKIKDLNEKTKNTRY